MSETRVHWLDRTFNLLAPLVDRRYRKGNRAPQHRELPLPPEAPPLPLQPDDLSPKTPSQGPSVGLGSSTDNEGERCRGAEEEFAMICRPETLI
jgi:hypothetical protein